MRIETQVSYYPNPDVFMRFSVSLSGEELHDAGDILGGNIIVDRDVDEMTRDIFTRL